MRATIMAVTCAIGAFVAQGEVKNTPMTPEKQAELIARSGGMLMPPSNGRYVLLADWRGEAPDGTNDIAGVFLEQQKVLFGLPIARERFGKPEPGSDAYRLLKSKRDDRHVAVIGIVDDPGMPRLAAFPEEAMACLNVSAYRSDDAEDAERERRRITRELWRAYGFAMGAYADIPQGCVMQVVCDNEMLDRIRTPAISPVRMSGVVKMAHALGLRAMRPTTYSVACRQGWAPPPTNDVQKALWDAAQKRNAEKAAREATRGMKSK